MDVTLKESCHNWQTKDLAVENLNIAVSILETAANDSSASRHLINTIRLTLNILDSSLPVLDASFKPKSNSLVLVPSAALYD